MSNSAEIIRSKDNGFLKHIRQLQQGGSKGQRARAESKQAVLDGIHLLQAWLGDPRLNCIVLTQDALLNAEMPSVQFSLHQRYFFLAWLPLFPIKYQINMMESRREEDKCPKT